METTPEARSTQKVRRVAGGGKRPDGKKQPGVRFRPDPKIIHPTPTDDRLTGLAGLVGFGIFLKRLGVDQALHDTFDSLKSGPSMVYRVGDVLRLILDAQAVGTPRVFGIEALAADPLFVQLAGGMVPSIDVLYDDLRRFGKPEITLLCKIMVGYGLAPLKDYRAAVLHIDIDTTVEPLFGTQEGAMKGHNSRYHGRPSYHPLVARVAEINLVVGALLRPGNTGFGEAEIGFLRRVIRDVRRAAGTHVLIVVRIDSAADCTAVLRELDELGVRFEVPIRMTPDVVQAFMGVPDEDWITVEEVDGLAVKQVTAVPFTRKEWDTQHVAWEVVGVREWDKTGGRKLYLWEGQEWCAKGFISNAWDWDLDEIAEDYDKRAGIEPLIGELKHGYGIGKVPTDDFDANHVMLLLKLLTYNLVERFVRSQHPTLSSWSIAWKRCFLFCVPGRLVHHAHRYELQVPAASPIARMLN